VTECVVKIVCVTECVVKIVGEYSVSDGLADNVWFSSTNYY
jgi:hypothetical protein